MRILGVDPGLSGALALLDPDDMTVTVHDMPTFEVKGGKKTRHELNVAAVAKLLAVHRPNFAFVEKVGAMPGQGVVSMFRFGEAYGALQGVIAALDIPVYFVLPQKWKGRLGLKDSSKGAARREATRLFPAYAQTFARVKDDGRAEATLIALYGAREYSRLTGAPAA